MMDKFMALRTWWHSVFANWSAERLPSYASWFIPEEVIPNVPGYAADALLVIAICMLLSVVLPLFHTKERKAHLGYALLMKLITIPVAFLGLIGLHFATNLFETLFMDTIPTLVEGFTETIPEDWNAFCEVLSEAKACPEGFWTYFGDELPEILERAVSALCLIPLGVILGVISVLVHGVGGLLCLLPFIGLLIAECWLFKLAGPIHFLADVGGAILLMLAVVVAIFCASLYMVGIMGIIYLTAGVIGGTMFKIVEVTVDVDPYS